MAKSNAQASQQLFWWDLDSWAKAKELWESFVTFQSLQNRDAMKGNALHMKSHLRCLLTLGPFEDAMKSIARTVRALEIEEQYNPNSLLARAILASHPKRGQTGATLLVIAYLKPYTRQIQEWLREAEVQHNSGDIFFKEVGYITGPFWKVDRKMRRILRKIKDIHNEVHRRNTSGRQQARTQHIRDIEGQMFITKKKLNKDIDEFQECLKEYVGLVQERMRRYQEISERNPDELPVIKSHMLSTEKDVPHDAEYVSRVNQGIESWLRTLHRLKIHLYALSHYFAQFNDPEISSFRRKPVEHFLENATRYQFPPMPQTKATSPQDPDTKPKRRGRSPSLHPDARCVDDDHFDDYK